MANFDFIVDVETGRLIADFSSTLGTTPQTFVYGDKPIVSVRFVESNGANEDIPWKQIDMTGATARVGIGNPGGDPASGTFTLTYVDAATTGGGTSAALNYNATAAEVQAAVNATSGVEGDTTVTAYGSGWRITSDATGDRGDWTANTGGLFPTTAGYIVTETEGDGSNAEVITLTLEQTPAAYTELTDDIAAPSATITTIRAGVTDTTAEQQRITISGDPWAGTYSLTIGSEATGAIAYDATTAEIKTAIEALASITVGAITITGDALDFTVEFASSLGNVGEATVDVSNLSGAIGKTGTLDCNVTGILELLDGASTVQSTLEIVKFATSGSLSDTVYQSACTVNQDVIPTTPPSETPMPSFAASSHTHTPADIVPSVVSKSATYTIAIADDLIFCTSNTFTLTLPTASSVSGQRHTIKNTGTGVITINTTSSQTIDQYASGAITLAQWEGIGVVSNGSNWLIIEA